MTSRARTSSVKKDFFSASVAVKKSKNYAAGETIVSQGENCSDIHYVEAGLVKLALVSKRGKGAVLGILAAGDFFGEACIGRDTVYSTSAIALAPTCVRVMSGKSMLRMLEENPGFAMRFMNYLLERNRRIEQDLIDHMLHFSEKRLARTLVSLSQTRHNDQMASLLANIGQDTLADMIGTTRSRVNFFMNKFRKSGHIDYSTGGGLKVHESLSTVLQE